MKKHRPSYFLHAITDLNTDSEEVTEVYFGHSYKALQQAESEFRKRFTPEEGHTIHLSYSSDDNEFRMLIQGAIVAL